MPMEYCRPIPIWRPASGYLSVVWLACSHVMPPRCLGRAWRFERRVSPQMRRG
jgi:hypothetical protein